LLSIEAGISLISIEILRFESYKDLTAPGRCKGFKDSRILILTKSFSPDVQAEYSQKLEMFFNFNLGFVAL
jgi:hypothetical protein